MNRSSTPIRLPRRSRSRGARRAAVAALPAGAVAGTLTLAPPAAAGTAADLAGKATCHTGRDDNGAYYAIAVRTEWNGSLVR